jgi:hypothetical protein
VRGALPPASTQGIFSKSYRLAQRENATTFRLLARLRYVLLFQEPEPRPHNLGGAAVVAEHNITHLLVVTNRSPPFGP